MLVVTDPQQVTALPEDESLVMAWAQDRVTKQARYILELGPERNGARCGCDCISCGLPLEAVNAGKFPSAYKRRPHFRHPKGARKEDCLVLTARALLLEKVREDGVLVLPRRQRSATAVGLSGKSYEAWVEVPPERVSIRSFQYCDPATAILFLDDGRELEVVLVGNASSDSHQTSDVAPIRPRILLVVDDPTVAAMSPQELRERLRLVSPEAVWCSHWNDPELSRRADENAKNMARDALDWIEGHYAFPPGTPSHTRRETLLHLKAKEILEREKRMALPEKKVEASRTFPSKHVIERSAVLVPQQYAKFGAVSLEVPMGQIKPDVVAVIEPENDSFSGRLLIEITVFNAISGERIERIRAVDLPTIEIDISRMGGAITEADFASLIVDELAGKKWLHFPGESLLRRRLEEELEHEAQQEPKRWAAAFLAAVERYGTLRALSDSVSDSQFSEIQKEGEQDSMEAALRHITECAEKLAAYGYPEAKDEFLFRSQGNILDRMMSLKYDRAVGYKIETAWQVINSILQEREPYNRWQTLYLLGIKVWQPSLTTIQKSRVEKWRQDVIDSLNAGEKTYRRSRKYDNFLGLLFPELAEALMKPLPDASKSQPTSFLRGGQHGTTDFRPQYGVQNKQQFPAEAKRSEEDPWLRGRAYEKWKKAHPESARAWEASMAQRTGKKISGTEDK